MRVRAVILTCLGILFVASPVQADHLGEDWSVGLDQDAVEGGVGVAQSGIRGSGVGGSGNYLYIWTLDACTPGGNPFSGNSVWVLIVTPGGQVVGEFCAAPGQVVAPPVPPTVDEIFQEAPLPRCEIRVNPGQKGLTGVESWLWCERIEEVTITAAIRGYRVQATASPTEFLWLPGDGASYISHSPGTEQDPSARHTFETKGDYVIAVDVAWSGTFTYQGHGIVESGSLAGVTVDSDRGYHVIESRGVLTQ